MGKLLEGDFNTTLHQSRTVYFNSCNGACWNSTYDAEQQFGRAAYFSCFGGENAE